MALMYPACGGTSRSGSTPIVEAGAGGMDEMPSRGGRAASGSGGAAAGNAGGAAGANEPLGGAAGESSIPGAGAAGDAGDGAGGEPPGSDPPNIVFVTSQAYVPATLGGLDGADEKCATLAVAAGLSGQFVAWLSTSQVDARDRLGGARGWRNTRGNPFADEVTELLDAGQVYLPIRYDEKAQPVLGKVATGTSSLGTAADETCDDWSSSSAADALVAGEATATTVLWTDEQGGAACSEPYHLYCFQVDHDSFQAPTPTQGRTVFVSALAWDLGVDGRDDADAYCQAEADAEQLGGDFVALLSTSTESALARLSNPSRTWVRWDGMVVADSSTTLLGGLVSGVTQRADGSYVGGIAILGAADISKKADLHCDDWTDPNAVVPAVIRGRVGYTDARWYAADTGACSERAHLLCVQR